MNFSTNSRPVNARASRTALIVASVPDETNRTMSIVGTAAATCCASCSSSSVGAPNVVPCAAASCTAATTAGWAWPAISGPHESTQST